MIKIEIGDLLLQKRNQGLFCCLGFTKTVMILWNFEFNMEDSLYLRDIDICFGTGRWEILVKLT